MYDILLVESKNDDRKILEKALIDNGHRVETVACAYEAVEMLANSNYRLIIASMENEALDGLQFFKIVNRIIPEAKKMLITNEPTIDDELAALEFNIDCYFDKNKQIKVFLKHVEVLLKGQEEHFSMRYVLNSGVDNVTVDLLAHTVKRNDVEIKMTPKEFAIIRLLLENKGRALSRAAIIEAVWDLPTEVIEDRVVDVHIKCIRRKLNTQAISTVRGFGYKWN